MARMDHFKPPEVDETVTRPMFFRMRLIVLLCFCGCSGAAEGCRIQDFGVNAYEVETAIPTL